MNRRPRLTLAYLQHDPESAARVLQSLDPAEVATFLSSVPVRLAAPVVNAMIPVAAARCLEGLEPHRAAGLLRELPSHDRTTLIRRTGDAVRNDVLAELPATMARRIARSLRYPANCVGAWIDGQIPVLQGDHLAADALRYLRRGARISHVFLESADAGEYVGAIALVDLVAARGEARLDELPIERVAPISNRATLAAARSHAAWDDYLALPVVGRRHNVLGGLSRRALREGLTDAPAATRRTGHPILTSLVDALLATATGLARLPLERPDDASRRQHGGTHGR